MPRGFFGSGWSDPIESLPKTPFQSPVIDPAQEAFQFPFQFPPQDPGQGEAQYAPVDVPENQLQEVFDPFEAWNDLNEDESFDWAQRFNPSGTLVSNAFAIGKGIAEQQGFDLGVFGEINLSGTLLSNLWKVNQWMQENPERAWDWAGDFPQLFEELFGETGNAANESEMSWDQNSKTPEDLEREINALFSDRMAAGESAEDIRGSEEMQSLKSEYTRLQESLGVTAEYPAQAMKGIGESEMGVAESPAVANVASLSTSGVDLNTPGIASGTAETMGLDVMPKTSELIELLLAL